MERFMFLTRAVKEHGYIAIYFDRDGVELYRASITLVELDRKSGGHKRKPSLRVRCKPNQRWAIVCASGALLPIGDSRAPKVIGY